ncbi:MAG: PAS domain-containing protein [Acidobacteriia bacterium]|nr:PAS domain-containing protein [Terriglobia bacterium]
MTSISRRTVAAAAVAIVPVMVTIAIWSPSPIARWLVLVWGTIALAVAWATARSLSRRISDLTRFANDLPNPGSVRLRLRFHDDELGELARSLSRTAPQVDAVLQGLSTELARREAILASMTEAVLAVDAKLNISFCNDAFVQVVGHPIAEGIPLIKVFRDPGLFQVLRRVIDSGETIRRRLSISVQADRWFDVYATALGNHPTTPGALAILQDVTPAERMERAQRDFVANVSHEFRTPLATITGCAETLLDGALDDHENRRKFLEVIHANSVRLTNIAADLITLSQLDGGGPRSEPAPISVEEVIAGALHVMEPVAGMHGIRIRADEICASRILGHRIAFEHAFLNLLDNAIKFSRPPGEVVVRAVVSEDEHVEISVSDSGIGIPAEELSRIFERFYRVDKARSRQIGGTGLGLSIVRHAVERMHGVVRVESQLGQGSCFTIAVPRYVEGPSS